MIARAEKTDLGRADGSAIDPVERDRGGEVTGLLVNDMTLTGDEFADLECLPGLRRLVLFRTNVADADLKRLGNCPHRESLTLTGTNVTDEAVDSLLGLKGLKYLCLGDVRMSPEAVANLKDRFKARGQEVRIGHTRRRD